MAQLINNTYRMPRTKLDYSRSLFKYKRTHSTNLLTGYIVPVAFINLMPGDTPPKDFGFQLQSAPLLGPSFDNVYIDIITVWCPTRLVMADHNQWLGDSDTYAFTFNRNVNLPRITKLTTGYLPLISQQVSLSYYAEHARAPHYGCRYFNQSNNPGYVDFTDTSFSGTGSRFLNGIQVIPFRMYDLIWNVLFRNQNIQAPRLFSKQSGTDLSLDVTNYQIGGGNLLRACRLKNFLNTARYSPAVETVDILAGINAPVNTLVNRHSVTGNDATFKAYNGTSWYDYVGSSGLMVSNGVLGLDTTTPSITSKTLPDNLYAELSGLTVNSLYFSIMLQRFFNKASTGRRPVEFYQEFFGIQSSEVGHDDPQLLSQKRFRVNISRVVATANSTDSQGNDQPIGTQGAYSLTGGYGQLFPSFTATEYGMIHVFAVIRTQESQAAGIDRYLSDNDLLSTYIPTFDHIGYDYIDNRERVNWTLGVGNAVFGYAPAWYHDRNFISDVTGIIAPGQPLDYFTLAREEVFGSSPVIDDDYIMQSPLEFDRMLQFPVCYQTPGAGVDVDGEPYMSNRYQWILQFAISGDFARTMSKDSEQLLF